MLWVNIGQKLVPFPKMFCKFVSACCNPFFYLIYSFDLGFIRLVMKDLHYSTCTYKYTIWPPIQDDLKY